MSFDLPVGSSYKRDRGVRNDSHDAIGVRLRVPLAASKKKRASDPMPEAEVPANKTRFSESAAMPGAASQAADILDEAQDDESTGQADDDVSIDVDDVSQSAKDVETGLREFWNNRGEAGLSLIHI